MKGIIMIKNTNLKSKKKLIQNE